MMVRLSQQLKNQQLQLDQCLGTFEGVINGNDVEFRVTMNSSSSATIKTKIDTLSS